MANSLILSDNNSKTCRICLDNDDPNDLIRPCLCSGGSAFVHRKCLDNWRAVNKDGRAFDYCDVCQFKFVIEPVLDDPNADSRRLLIYRLLVTRDITLVVLAIQAVLIGLMFALQALDKNSHGLRNLFPESANSLGIYYLCSLLLFLVILGFFGLIGYCVSSSNNDQGSFQCCYLSMYCGGCGGDDSGICIFILLAIVVAFVFLGIFVGIVLGGMLIKNSVKRHSSKLWLRQETKKFVVKDFTDNPDELRNESTQHAGSNSISVIELKT